MSIFKNNWYVFFACLTILCKISIIVTIGILIYYGDWLAVVSAIGMGILMIFNIMLEAITEEAK